MIRDIIIIDAGARRRPRALENIQILQQKRHAGKGAIRKPLVDLPPGIVIMLHDHRIDLRIDLGGAGDRLVQQFRGADLLFPDELGEAHPVIAGVFPECHIDTYGAVLSRKSRHRR